MKKTEDKELAFANHIAGAPKDLDNAASQIAAAAFWCRGHWKAAFDDGTVKFRYNNQYGPTIAVDDVLERMTMHDWRNACDKFLSMAIRNAGVDPR